jgi:26S proteasome regulatory subunit N10
LPGVGDCYYSISIISSTPPPQQVGVLTMAGKGVELLVSPTDDVGKLLSCLHGVKVS